MLCRSLFVLYLLSIVLSVHLWFTDSDYPFGIFKLVLNTLSSFWSLFAYCCMLSGEKQIPNLYVFGLTRPVLESINYRTGANTLIITTPMRFLRTWRYVLIHRGFNATFFADLKSDEWVCLVFNIIFFFFKISNRNNILTMNKLLTFGRFHEIKFKQAYDEWVGRVFDIFYLLLII